jgi:hypothetical protein
MNRRETGYRCKGKTKQGRPCRAAATAGGLCFFHANPDKASELGRIGGQRNRRWVPSEKSSLPAIDTAVAVRDLLARLIPEVYEGRVHPRIASGLVPLLNSQMRAIEVSSLEQRIAALERAGNDTKLNGDPGLNSDSESGEPEPGGD